MRSIWACDVPTTHVFPTNSIVVFKYIWSPRRDGTHTPPKDIEYILTEPTMFGTCVGILEDMALRYVKSQGANHLRQYYIEGYKEDTPFIEILLGT